IEAGGDLMFSRLEHQGLRKHVQPFADNIGAIRGSRVTVSIHSDRGRTIGTGLVFFIGKSQWVRERAIVAVGTLETNCRVGPAISDIVDQARRKRMRPSDRQILWRRREGLAVE